MYIMGPEFPEAFTDKGVPTAKLLNWVEKYGLRMDDMIGLKFHSKIYVVAIAGEENRLIFVDNLLVPLPNQRKPVVQPALSLPCPENKRTCVECHIRTQLKCRGRTC